MSATSACTVEVPCFTSTRDPGVSGRGSSWNTAASSSRRGSESEPAAAITAPRAASTSSARLSETESGADASSTATGPRSMRVTVVVTPAGNTCTESHTRTVPDSMRPANAR